MIDGLSHQRISGCYSMFEISDCNAGMRAQQRILDAADTQIWEQDRRIRPSANQRLLFSV